MTRYIVDTNIVRFYIEGNRKVERFWDSCRNKNDTFLLSMVTVGELKSQMIEIKPRQRMAVRRLINAFPKIDAYDPEDRKAHAYRRVARSIRSYHQKEKHPFQPKLPDLADAKIAVDAINEKVDIITNNTKDFHIARFLGVSLYDPIRDRWFEPIAKTEDTPSKFILPNEKYD